MQETQRPYDKSNPEDIERYAKQLKDHTFLDVLANFLYGTEKKDTLRSAQSTSEDGKLHDKLLKLAHYYNNPRAKGGLGNLLEKYFFLYEPNSVSGPDFTEAGTELKVTPYEKTKKGPRAGERLVIGMIPNRTPIETDFTQSDCLKKMQLLLLIFYLREKGVDRVNFSIDYVKLFSILSEKCKEDYLVIKDDYEKIIGKITAGKAHELSEGDTRYLGACTKGGSLKTMIQPQYYNPGVPAKRRAFSLKQSYMTYILNHYIINNIETYESALSEEKLKEKDFDSQILEMIRPYIGMSEETLYQLFDLKTDTKQRNRLVICRILGVQTDNIAEFAKADIEIKTIRVKANGAPRESMSFPAIVIHDFLQETFEDSQLYNFFSTKRFLFIVFREHNGIYTLDGAKFWNMPITELETTGKDEWLAAQNCFKNGVHLEINRYRTGKKKNDIYVTNNLPSSSETEIFHLRPHAQRGAHIINGTKYGNGEEKDMDTLPNGDKMTKQSFWLNKKYVARIISDI